MFAFGVAALVVGPVSSQTADEVGRYKETVHEYQHGNADAALRIAAEWPRKDLERILRRMLTEAVAGARSDTSTNAWRLVEAAVLLHTEIALAGVPAADSKLIEQLSLAEGVVRELPWRATAPFPQRWYTLAASVHLWQTRPVNARPYVDRGLRIAPNDPQLHLTAGIIHELTAHATNPSCSTPRCDTSGPRRSPTYELSLAAAEYRRVLELDHGSVEARLRLGRVLFLTDDREGARTWLNAASVSRTGRFRYLAELFIGALDEFENDFGSAMRHYDAAVSAGPSYQTGHVARSLAQLMNGSSGAARQTISTLGRFARSWGCRSLVQDQNGGVNSEALEWLRNYVRD